MKILTIKVFSGEFGSYAKKLETELLREYKKITENVATEPQTLDDLDAIPAMDLIIGGETDKVEFKSSFIWDIERKQCSKEVRIAVMRAVSSFMNSEGGFLIIGVDDDNSPVGIGFDLEHVQNSFDTWGQTLTNAINTYLGKINGAFVSIRKVKVEDKEIVILRVRKSPHPVYLKYEEGKEDFFIRSNNTSQKLGMSESTQYIQEHWKDQE